MKNKALYDELKADYLLGFIHYSKMAANDMDVIARCKYCGIAVWIDDGECPGCGALIEVKDEK